MKRSLIVEAWMNIIDHLYIMVLDIWELEGQRGKKKSRTRLANTYDKSLRVDQV